MHAIENLKTRAADLYWLAFLLTGDREVSVDVAVGALDLPDGANTFFSTWMLKWERKVVIAKALAAIREELAASAARTGAARNGNGAPSPRNRAILQETNKAQLERALLALDVFPRCALLLATFEQLSADDVTILLDCDRDSLRKAQRIGFRELNRALANMQGEAPAAGDPAVLISEVQHA